MIHTRTTLTILALLLTVLVSAMAQAHHGKSHRMKEALNSEEKLRVLESVRQKNPKLDHRRRAARRAVNNAMVADEPVLLMVERRPADKNPNASRTANVYYYDYRKDQTIHAIVDAESGKVHKQVLVRNLQLPLIDDEVQRAFDIYTQSRFRTDLADAYFETTGQALIDISKVHFKAYVFHASVNEELLNKKTRRCGKTRCAQLLLYTEDNIAMNLSPVVNLSRGVVIQGNTLPSSTSGNSTPATTRSHESIEEEH